MFNNLKILVLIFIVFVFNSCIENSKKIDNNFYINMSRIYNDKEMKRRVKSIIERMLIKEKAASAYLELEMLGHKATPYIIMLMDDYREVPIKTISLKNKSKNVFESVRYLKVIKIEDVLSEILAQNESKNFLLIAAEDKTDKDRKNEILAWRKWLSKQNPSRFK